MRRLLFILAVALTGIAVLPGSAAAHRVLTVEEAKAQIRGDLAITFREVSTYTHKYVLGLPLGIGISSCRRLTAFKVECVGRVESTGAAGEVQVCLVPEEVAHRAERGRSIAVTGNGPVTCRLREAAA